MEEGPTISLQILEEGLVKIVVGIAVLLQPEDALPRCSFVFGFEHGCNNADGGLADVHFERGRYRS